MKYKKQILIIEDEEANAQRLQRMLYAARPTYEVLEVLPSIRKSVQWLSSEVAPELIFMDIRLADGICFEIFNQVQVNTPIIFTTAYDEYTLQAFKHNSVHYLLKPVESEELEAAIRKFENTSQPAFAQHSLIKDLMQYLDKKEYRTRFLLPFRDGYEKLSVDDISFFYSESGTTFAISFQGAKKSVAQTLETLDEQLDPRQFFRANRQYIVHINAIERVHNYFNSKLKLDVKQCKEGIVVSKSKATSLKDWLDY